ncbi:16S rRNA (cytosine(1402)-N(4))-methyltransferase [Hahella sp. CCB-MM4]|uniref:16S rRNA (cytosine(1402)-N(4))-methyltransferase RsmH n=1 Tax=Hahella sp. (strain CCB-MM4) TaxID=1926491 RepID=UPI000B9AE4CB|nr:16S rRNA (cytosine(1402)-N(4))-methyltransferase RsmH [Hahella sp. CCB-MM4]OZG71992.1 16S rRNA (cytosine(1402)-N(4))-methyltransferase [Hahella sp. CCB-MM4]
MSDVFDEFAHITVLLKEAVEALAISKDGKYVDGTFGRGGHSRAILEQLGSQGQLLGIDKDPRAEQSAHELKALDSRFLFYRGSFADIRKAVSTQGWEKVDGVLLDLGVSSPQLDDASRGFSFNKEGPLDMRMDPEKGESAADWINRAPEEEIARVIWEYGEERYSRRMAKAIVKERENQAIVTTQQLSEIVAAAHPRWEKGKHPATRAFQAIRIHINSELDDLDKGLQEAFDCLAPGGRLAVISFHSLEDRKVKHFMRDIVKGPQLPKWVPIHDEGAPKAKLIGKKIKAGKDELAVNVRSRSAVMRVMEKCA